MKTTLPAEILTVKDAEKFLLELIKNKEEFHPEDDAHDIFWGKCKEPTKKELDQLNKLMEDIHELENFDPCGFIIDNSDWNK